MYTESDISKGLELFGRENLFYYDGKRFRKPRTNEICSEYEVAMTMRSLSRKIKSSISSYSTIYWLVVLEEYCKSLKKKEVKMSMEEALKTFNIVLQINDES